MALSICKTSHVSCKRPSCSDSTRRSGKETMSQVRRWEYVCSVIYVASDRARERKENNPHSMQIRTQKTSNAERRRKRKNKRETIKTQDKYQTYSRSYSSFFVCRSFFCRSFMFSCMSVYLSCLYFLPSSPPLSAVQARQDLQKKNLLLFVHEGKQESGSGQ